MNLYEFYSSNKKVNITENLIHAKDVESEVITENLRKWFKEKWVRFGPDGKIRGECARGSESEGKPKCLPRSKAHSLGKKGRASAASKKRREDPNPERRGAAINVSTKVKENQEIKLKNVFENKASAMGTDSAAQAQRNKLSAASVGTGPGPGVRSQTSSTGVRVQSPVQQVDPAAAARAAARQAAAKSVATSPAAPVARPAPVAPVSTTVQRRANEPRRGAMPRAGTGQYYQPEPTARDLDQQLGRSVSPAAPVASTSVQRNQFDTRRGAMPRAGTGQYYQPEPTARDLDQQLGQPPVASAASTSSSAPATTSVQRNQFDTRRGSMPRVGTDSYYVPGGNIHQQMSQAQRDAEDQSLSQLSISEPIKPRQQMSLTQRDAEDQSLSQLSISEPAIPNSTLIQRGDTLSAIARQNDTTVAELMRLNPQIKDPNKIFAGATLNLPPFTGSSAAATPEIEPKRPAQSAPTSAATTDTEIKPPAQSAANTAAQNARAEQEPGVSISPDDMSPDTRQTSTGRAAPLTATAPALTTSRDVSDDVLGNFTRQNRNIKIDKDTLANAMSLGLVDRSGVPDKKAIETWQKENGFKGRDVDGLLGPQTGAKINELISKRDQGSAARAPLPASAATQPTDQQQELRSNLTPEQLRYAGSADLSRPETGSTGVIQRMPLPRPEEMADVIGKAESQKNPDIAFGDVVRNGQIINVVKANKGSNIGEPLLTAEQWSKRNLGSSKKLSDMSVEEVMRFQKYRSNNHSNANAVGAYQFVGDTLEDLVKKAGIDPKTTKFDQETQNILLQELTKENARVLKRNGIVPDKVNLYMAHAVGGRGAVDIYDNLRQNPNKTVIDSLMDGWKKRNPDDSNNPVKVEAQRRRLLAGNPHFRDMKVGEYYNYLSGATRGDRRDTDYYRRTKTSQVREEACPHCSGPMFNIDMLTEKKDACYYKVKSRYKVWPSAYASGALVKCRKRGASNWGKSKTNENLYFNVVGTDKKTLITEFNMRRDVRGWYLTGDSASSTKLDAFRAFGAPLTEEELNPTAYSGSAATINVDNPISPVGSLSKSQRINKKSRSK